MKELVLPKPSAKNFLLQLVPNLLKACNINPVQSFFGFQFDIQVEAQKRIAVMNEQDAITALKALKTELAKW